MADRAGLFAGLLAELLAVVAVGAMSPAPAVATPSAPGDFVVLQDVDPTILADIRYFTAHNFVGDPIDGYRAPVCILTRPAAEALARAQREFLDDGLTLKVYHCYRPKRANSGQASNRLLLTEGLARQGFVNDDRDMVALHPAD